MRKPQLITFSGMVGSGKTTNAKKTMRLLNELGYSPYYLRFRFLRWSHLVKPPAPEPWRAERRANRSRQRGRRSLHESNRQLHPGKRLSLVRFMGYLIRVLRFRLILFRHYRERLVVVNRYFYDSLAHYRFSTRRERAYSWVLNGLIPKPDLAFLLVLRPESARRRRPSYSRAALRRLSENYQNLLKNVKHLSVVATDNLATGDRHIDKRVREIFAPKPIDAYEKESRS